MNLQVTRVMTEALKQNSDGAFQVAAAALGENQSVLREEIQQKTADRIAEIVNNLSADKPLSPEDISLVRLWVVGDAAAYVQAEDDFNAWVEEYKQMVGVLQGFENKTCSQEDLLKLGGILEDAIRLSFDIANFLEKKERIAKFDAAVKDGIDDDEKEILVRVLTGKFRSEDC
ncbi:MAG: hypothetical protein WCI27_04125 [Candidatus Omnitrophota bacterium]